MWKLVNRPEFNRGKGFGRMEYIGLELGVGALPVYSMRATREHRMLLTRPGAKFRVESLVKRSDKLVYRRER